MALMVEQVDPVAAATYFVTELGCTAFPVWGSRNGKCLCGDPHDGTKKHGPDNVGKHPATIHGFQDATADVSRIATFLHNPGTPNYGLNAPEGVLVIDVDGEGLARWEELQHLYGPLPVTLTTTTANGRHYFYRWPESCGPMPRGKLFGFVVRRHDDGYVIGPGSVHPSGVVYDTLRQPTRMPYPIADLPRGWAEAAATGKPLTITGPVPPEQVHVGGRHDWLRDRARHYAGVVRDPELLRMLLLAENAKLSEPKSEEAVDRAIGDVLRKFGPDPKPIPVDTSETRIDGADLIALDLPPLEWIVPEILPEGTAILAAPPKVGKSCLVYQIAVETALGGSLFGRRVKQGSVLYLALEDGRRRGKQRLLAALDGRRLLHECLTVQWSSNRIGQGLEADIDEWLGRHPDARLVAIDTLQKVRPRTSGQRGAYEVDVEDLGQLQNLFRDRSIGLLVVHHTRKQAEDDFLTAVSGTYGITGSADTTLVIKRKRLEAFGSLTVTGRDVSEAEIAVQFNGMLWTEAPGGMAEASFQRSEVYNIVKDRGPIWPKQIADALGVERSAIQHIVTRMADIGSIVRTNDGYRVTGVTLVTGGVTPNVTLEESDESDAGERPTRARAYARATYPLSLSSLSLTPDGQSDVSDVGHTRAPAREGEWLRPCRSYLEHQGAHRQTAGGWVCDVCWPEEGATA